MAILNKNGAYVSPAHWSREYQQALVNLSPKGMKVMDFLPSRAEEFYKAIPQAEFLFRDFPFTDQHSDMWRDPKGTGIRHAEEATKHMEGWRKAGKLTIPQEQIVWQLVNEPEVWRNDQRTSRAAGPEASTLQRRREAIEQSRGLLDRMEQISRTLAEGKSLEMPRAAGVSTEGTKIAVEYNYHALQRGGELGTRMGAINMAVGWPTNYGIPDNPPDWGPWEPVLRLCEKLRHPVCLHEYSDDRGVKQHWGWWMGRYQYLTPQLYKGEIIIGECGIEMGISQPAKFGDGWQTVMSAPDYAKFMQEYDLELSKDDRIAFSCWYMLDYADNYWRTMNIYPVLEQKLIPRNTQFYFGANALPKPGSSAPPTPPPPPPDTGSPIAFIDVSHHQKSIDWGKVAKAGVEGAIIKMTEGITYVDPQFETNLKGALAQGLFVGVYHYFWNELDPVAQVRNILKTLAGRVPPFIVIDVEKEDTLTPAVRGDRLKQILAELEAAGHTMWIYTGRWYWDTAMPRDPNWSKYPLWVATYGNTVSLPADWKTWEMWQYSATSKVDGIAGVVDANRAKHTVAEYRTLYGDWGTGSQDLRKVLLEASKVNQLIQNNPDAALTKAWKHPGWSPVGNEFRVMHEGSVYIAQGTEDMSLPGSHRVFYVLLGDWGNVKFVDR